MSLILPLKTDDIYIVYEMMITLLTENGYNCYHAHTKRVVFNDKGRGRTRLGNRQPIRK